GLEEILSYIPPDCDRNAWIGILGGIQATNLRDVEPRDMDGELLVFAQNWSAGGYTPGKSPPTSWQGHDDVEHAYWSLEPEKEGGTTFGTLYHKAKEAGYDKPPPQATATELMGDTMAAILKKDPTPVDPILGKRHLRLVRGADTEAEPIEWLMPGYL